MRTRNRFDMFWSNVVGVQATRIVRAYPMPTLTRSGHVADLRGSFELKTGSCENIERPPPCRTPHYATLRPKKPPRGLPLEPPTVDIDVFIAEMAAFSKSLEARTEQLRQEKETGVNKVKEADQFSGRSKVREVDKVKELDKVIENGWKTTVVRSSQVAENFPVYSDISDKQPLYNGVLQRQQVMYFKKV